MKETKLCCQLNTTLQKIYYEQIHGKKYHSMGYYATYYYLLKEYKKQGKLCPDCENFAGKIWELHLTNKSK